MIKTQQSDRNFGTEFSALLETAHQAADLARGAILPHFRNHVDVENKAERGAYDPVTVADREAERIIRSHIESSWPEHGFIGEEFGRIREDSRMQWIVDPIDGTRSFIIGSPLWGTLIGLTFDNSPILGILDQPFTGERFFADRDHTYLRMNDTVDPIRLCSRTCSRLDDAVLATTHPDHFETDSDLQQFFRLKKKVRLSRYGGDCYNYALLSAGFVDLVVESGLNTYDVIALIPIVERAGGRITTWDGESATNGGRILAAGDPSLHEAAMKVLMS